MKIEKGKNIFKNFGPAFLILALGIGSGEFILWPYLSANYGFGILWGALLGITLQLFLIQVISRNTILLGENIIKSFSLVFSGAFFWIIFSTFLGFGWPGFSSLSAELLIGGFGLDSEIFLELSIFILLLAGAVLVFSKNAYKKILFLEKLAMSALFLLTLFLFAWYFDLKIFGQMLTGFFGFGENYFFLPENILAGGFLATFLGAVAYAGSGGNLLLANSFYVLEDEKRIQQNNLSEKKENEHSYIQLNVWMKNIFRQNFIFFWGGGLAIIGMLSYISFVVLQGSKNIAEDFSFLILESKIFSADISPIAGYLFIFLGAFALFGVQLGIFDFLGRIAKSARKFYLEEKAQNNYKENYTYILKNVGIEKVSDRFVYNSAVLVMVFFGLIVFLLGFEKPKTLITIGAVINAFSMGVIAFLLLLLEVKKIPKEWKSKKIILGTFLAGIFYISFFLFVVFDKFL